MPSGYSFDSSGTVVDEDGFTTEKLARLEEIKNNYGRIEEYAKEFGLTCGSATMECSCRYRSAMCNTK